VLFLVFVWRFIRKVRFLFLDIASKGTANLRGQSTAIQGSKATEPVLQIDRNRGDQHDSPLFGSNCTSGLQTMASATQGDTTAGLQGIGAAGNDSVNVEGTTVLPDVLASGHPAFGTAIAVPMANQHLDLGCA
jgi:hypothetical protein